MAFPFTRFESASLIAGILALSALYLKLDWPQDRQELISVVVAQVAWASYIVYRFYRFHNSR
ncbi:MAG TPA: hypothetical protein VD994_09785 [Prosthecobacter sp.]|nr:hypothetical protein [Prosthecobacter sp.]